MKQNNKPATTKGKPVAAPKATAKPADVKAAKEAAKPGGKGTAAHRLPIFDDGLQTTIALEALASLKATGDAKASQVRDAINGAVEAYEEAAKYPKGKGPWTRQTPKGGRAMVGRALRRLANHKDAEGNATPLVDVVNGLAGARVWRWGLTPLGMKAATGAVNKKAHYAAKDEAYKGFTARNDEAQTKGRHNL